MLLFEILYYLFILSLLANHLRWENKIFMSVRTVDQSVQNIPMKTSLQYQISNLLSLAFIIFYALPRTDPTTKPTTTKSR